MNLLPKDDNPAEILISTAQKVWIPFVVSFPPEKTLEMEVFGNKDTNLLTVLFIVFK